MAKLNHDFGTRFIGGTARVSGGFFVRFAAWEPEGREAKRSCPVKKLVF
jgi:hypothetical protein